MASITVLNPPKPESREEVLEALRAAMAYATNANIAQVDIRLTYARGASVTISSDK